MPDSGNFFHIVIHIHVQRNICSITRVVVLAISIQTAKYYKNIDGIVLIVKKFSQGNKTIMTIGWMTGSHLCYLLHNIRMSLRTQLRSSSCCIYSFLKPSYTSLQILYRHILLQVQWNKLVYKRCHVPIILYESHISGDFQGNFTTRFLKVPSLFTNIFKYFWPI